MKELQVKGCDVNEMCKVNVLKFLEQLCYYIFYQIRVYSTGLNFWLKMKKELAEKEN